MHKNICLGTAMWGWNVDKKTAFQFLDMYYQNGGRYIDTAFNYPINGIRNDLSFAMLVLSEWIRVNKIIDLKVIFKYGSIDNQNTPQSDLSAIRTNEMFELAQERFGKNLYSLMIHWDSRSEHRLIDDTIFSLSDLSKKHSFNIGLSGIKEIDYYRSFLKKLGTQCVDHEIKHAFNTNNLPVLDASLIPEYRFWAYGISGSGLKLDEKDYRSDSYVKLVRSSDFHRDNLSYEDKVAIKSYIDESDLVNNLYEYSMLMKEKDPRFYGYIVSPSRVLQLEQIISFRHRLHSSFG